MYNQFVISNIQVELILQLAKNLNLLDHEHLILW